jgi:hypothetical protein
MEEYTIGQVRGFQVTGKDYYSVVFEDIKDAQKLKAQLESSKEIEKVQIIKAKK